MTTPPEPEHFSKVVAPALVGFTLPTVALVATQKDLAWGEAALVCFLLSSGLLLTAFQLSLGRLAQDTGDSGLPWDLAGLRFVISSIGMLAMAAGLGFIVLPSQGLAAINWRLLAVAVLLAGTAIPLGMRVGLWAAHGGADSFLRRSRRAPAQGRAGEVPRP